jgi:hypothetical protein
MVEPVSTPSREHDPERALREVSRVGDVAVAGLLRGLVEMQADLIRRLEAAETRLAALEARPQRRARPSHGG